MVVGIRLLRETASGLPTTPCPTSSSTGVAGSRRFVAFHLLVPGSWCVQAGHDLCRRIGREIRSALPRTDVITHLEPLEDPRAWQDTCLGWDEP